jgi:hypothetical protein
MSLSMVHSNIHFVCHSHVHPLKTGTTLTLLLYGMLYPSFILLIAFADDNMLWARPLDPRSLGMTTSRTRHATWRLALAPDFSRLKLAKVLISVFALNYSRKKHELIFAQRVKPTFYNSTSFLSRPACTLKAQTPYHTPPAYRSNNQPLRTEETIQEQ